MTTGPLADEVKRLIDGVEASTGYRPPIAAGADTKEIEAIEADLGVTFGPQLRELYLASDGGVEEPIFAYPSLQFLQESTEFVRAELTLGVVGDEDAVRAVMDTTRLVGLAVGLGDYWIVSPDDPEERVYLFGFIARRFGVIGRDWRSLAAMYADFAEEGYIDVVDPTGSPFLDWRMVGDGQEAREAIFVPDTRAQLAARYQVELMP